MMDDQFDQEWIAGALDIGIWKLEVDVITFWKIM